MPDKRDVHVEKLLTGMAVKYAQEATDYIASQVYPEVPVVKHNDKYATYNKENLFRQPDNALRAPKTESKEVDWGVGNANYDLKNYALHTLIADEERENADPPFNLDIDGTEVVTSMLMNLKEQRVADQVTNAANYTGDTANTDTLAGTDQWSDASQSDPIGDINTGMNAIRDNSAKKANTLALGWQVYQKLKVNDQIVTRLGTASLNTVTLDNLRILFDVERILVGGAQKDTSNPGQGSPTINNYIWGKDAVLAYVNPGIRTTKGLTLGVTFTKGNMTVSRFRIDAKKSDKIEIDHYTDENIIAYDCGYLWKNAVA